MAARFGGEVADRLWRYPIMNIARVKCGESGGAGGGGGEGDGCDEGDERAHGPSRV